MQKPNLIVVGNGMVGQRFLQCIAEKNLTTVFNVITFCEEPRPAYDRVHLTEFFSGKTAGDLSLVENDFFASNGITVHLGDSVVAIDREQQTVTSQKGLSLPYDKVVLATGSYPFVPPIPGNDRPGCFVYRTIEDLEAIVAASESATTGAVIGGGLLGLEAANALTQLGLQTHVIEFAPRLMAIQVDDTGAGLLRSKIE